MDDGGLNIAKRVIGHFLVDTLFTEMFRVRVAISRNFWAIIQSRRRLIGNLKCACVICS